MPTPNNQPNPLFDFAEPLKRSPPVPDAFKTPPPANVTKFEPPPVTRIYPQPINPPPAPSPAPASVPSRPSVRSGGRIAGSFRMPPSAGVAARTSASVLGRRIPYVALAFLAYDAYQLACSLQLIPGSACPRPDNPSPGGKASNLIGGQCVGTLYYIQFDGMSERGILIQQMAYINIPGPIRSLEFLSTPFQGGTEAETRLYYGNTSQLKRHSNCNTGGSPTYCGLIDLRNIQIFRMDGGLDNCGNPPRQPTPQAMPDQINNIINFHRNININITIPSPQPPTPQPRPAPRLISPPSPLPEIVINFGDNYFGGGDTDFDFDVEINFSPSPKGNYNDYPDIFNNFPPAPQPKTREPDPVPKNNPEPVPAPVPPPVPEVPPPVPDTLPPGSTDQDKYIYRQNKETLDKLYKANAEILEIQKEQTKQSKILENIQNLLDFELEGSQLIKRCDDLETFYSYKDKALRAINRQIQHVQEIEQTIINEVCEVEKESIIASPESWGLRLRVDVPQIALVFRVLGTRTYHKITLPHPLSTEKISAPIIASYKKGNWQGELVCVDNSKFIINCESRIEAERVLNLAILFMDPLFVGQTPRLYFAERRGVTVSTGNMLATSALYFSEGQQHLKPDWRVAFKYL